MPDPLSKDLRKRIIELHEKGKTVAKVAKEKMSVNKLMALYRETGNYELRPLNNG